MKTKQKVSHTNWREPLRSHAVELGDEEHKRELLERKIDELERALAQVTLEADFKACGLTVYNRKEMKLQGANRKSS